MTKESVNFREVAKSFSTQKVNAMAIKLEASFKIRDAFEASQGLNLDADSSYTRERDAMLKAKNNVARFFLALEIEPNAVIHRHVVSNAMFNAKALKKVRELANFAVSGDKKLELVMSSFITCALASADKKIKTLTNSVNASFLRSSDLSNVIKDSTLLDYIYANRHKAMTTGALTQSSQARNVLDVLGLGLIVTVDKARDAIQVHENHAFFNDFRKAYMTS